MAELLMIQQLFPRPVSQRRRGGEGRGGNGPTVFGHEWTELNYTEFWHGAAEFF